MTKVVIRDQLMGTGKSTMMIEEINNSDSDQKFIVVLPFLSECHRYAGTTPDPDSQEKQKPLLDDSGNVIYNGTGCNASGRLFRHPIAGYRNKVEHIEDLVNQGIDIVTTHAAIKLFTPNTKAAIQDNNYRLIIDEELECIKPVPLRRIRRTMLLDSGVIEVDSDTNLLRWADKGYDADDIDDRADSGLSWDTSIKKMCDNGSLILVPDENGNRNFFMWEYPVEFIKAFDRVDVLTYNSEGSIFEKYLKFYNIPYTIEKGIQYQPNIKDLLKIVDSEKMNRAGLRSEALSANNQRGFTKQSAHAATLKRNLENFYNNKAYPDSSPEERLWTCLSGARNILKGRGYTKRFIPCNTKAVNDYMNTSKLAYVYNSYLHPDVYRFMAARGQEYAPDQSQYSTNELLQWIYRSRIRNDEEITLYIPSSRMRDYLQDWLDKSSQEVKSQ